MKNIANSNFINIRNNMWHTLLLTLFIISFPLISINAQTPGEEKPIGGIKYVETTGDKQVVTVINTIITQNNSVEQTSIFRAPNENGSGFDSSHIYISSNVDENFLWYNTYMPRPNPNTLNKGDSTVWRDLYNEGIIKTEPSTTQEISGYYRIFQQVDIGTHEYMPVPLCLDKKNIGLEINNPLDAVTDRRVAQIRLYVTSLGDGVEDGSSWENAMSGDHLQNAINTLHYMVKHNMTTTGNYVEGEVWLGTGTNLPEQGNIASFYPTHISPLTRTEDATDPRLYSFIMRKGVSVYGGMLGNETSKDDVTNRIKSITLLNGGDNVDTRSYNTVVFDSTATGLPEGISPAKLKGVIISNGNANHLTDTTRQMGGGVYLSADGILKACAIMGNKATKGGGGVYMAEIGTKIYNSFVYQNEAPLGSGILTHSALKANTSKNTKQYRIQTSTIAENTGTDPNNRGAAAVFCGSNTDIRCNVIWNNKINSDLSTKEKSANIHSLSKDTKITLNALDSVAVVNLGDNTDVILHNDNTGKDDDVIEIGGKDYDRGCPKFGKIGESLVLIEKVYMPREGSILINRVTISDSLIATYGEFKYDFFGEPRTNNNHLDLGKAQAQINRELYPAGNRIYVSPTAQGKQDGSSWDNAVGFISLALNFAKDTLPPLPDMAWDIWVKGGIYIPNMHATEETNPESITFALNKNVNLYGGFEGTEETLEDRKIKDINGNGVLESWEFANQTILSGYLFTQEKKIVRSTHIMQYEIPNSIAPQSSSKLTDLQQELADPDKAKTLRPVRIDGFRFSNGYATNMEHVGSGGAIKSKAPLRIENCLFDKNACIAGSNVDTAPADKLKNAIRAAAIFAYHTKVFNCQFENNHIVDENDITVNRDNPYESVVHLLGDSSLAIGNIFTHNNMAPLKLSNGATAALNSCVNNHNGVILASTDVNLMGNIIHVADEFVKTGSTGVIDQEILGSYCDIKANLISCAKDEVEDRETKYSNSHNIRISEGNDGIKEMAFENISGKTIPVTERNIGITGNYTKVNLNLLSSSKAINQFPEDLSKLAELAKKLLDDNNITHDIYGYPSIREFGTNHIVEMGAVQYNSKTFIFHNSMSDSLWSTPENWAPPSVPSYLDKIAIENSAKVTEGCAKNNLSTDMVISDSIEVKSNGSITIAPKAMLQANAITGTTKDNLILLADTNSQASLFIDDTTANIEASWQVYSKAFHNKDGVAHQSKFHWQYISTPFASALVDPALADGWMQRRQEDDKLVWFPLANGYNLTRGQGYIFTQLEAGVRTFTGNLEFSDVTVNLTKSNAITDEGNVTDNGYNLVGNPFPAALNINELVFEGDAEKTVYLYNTGHKDHWTAESGSMPDDGTNPGQYIALPQKTAATLGQAHIPSGQAFFVRVHNNSQPSSTATGSITMKASSLEKNTAPMRSPKRPLEHIKIRVEGSRFADMAYLFLQEGTSPAFDNGWDGVKMFGEAVTPQIYILGSDDKYAVQATSQAEGTVIAFTAGEDSRYVLSLDLANANLDEGNLRLRNVLTEETVEISDIDSVSIQFTAVPEQEVRFIIERSEKVPTGDDTLDGDLYDGIFVTSRGKTIVVEMAKPHSLIIVTDLTGRTVIEEQANANGGMEHNTSLPSGCYIVQIEGGSHKIIIQ